MSEYLPGLIWLVVLLLANGFFVGAEFAVISARRSQIEPLAERGSAAARTALWAMEHATLMLATSQLGITICSLVILNVSEPAIHHLLEIPFEWIGIPTQSVTLIAFIVALALVTFLHVVVGEMVPKNIAFSIPDRAVLFLAPPLVLVSRIFKPVIWLLNEIANSILRAFRVEPKDEAASTYTLDQIATIVEQSTQEGVLFDVSGTVSAAFEFTEKTVGDIEVPLSDVVLLPPGATAADVQAAVAEHGFSRYIVSDPAGQPAGYVHVKDVMDLARTESFDQGIPPIRIRSLATMNRHMEIEDALASLRQSGDHVARVVGMGDALTGVLFLEDILEELIGEVDDATQLDDPEEWHPGTSPEPGDRNS